ncbi:unnamed protein product [Arctia plantaginis]|uniref:Uncharacterized protein n=1 Tax=Arctia plantaginis TaxID=874455 RepID=A0A8S1B6J3_ARCPL|nr:unnamed protein product [Arctia plantaginis]
MCCQNFVLCSRGSPSETSIKMHNFVIYTVLYNTRTAFLACLQRTLGAVYNVQQLVARTCARQLPPAAASCRQLVETPDCIMD